MAAWKKSKSVGNAKEERERESYEGRSSREDPVGAGPAGKCGKLGGEGGGGKFLTRHGETETGPWWTTIRPHATAPQ